MRKWTVLAASVLFLLFVGCGTAQSAYDEESIIALAKDTVAELQAGNFDVVESRFSDTFTEAVDFEEVELAWEDTIADIGAHLGHDEVTHEMLDDYFVVYVTEEYEITGVTVTLAFNEAEQLEGIYFKYAPISNLRQNDILTEFHVSLGADPEMPLAGTLTLPNGVEQPPVVLLVHGSGASNRDEAVGLIMPFKDIAHALAEQGIATLRYDKRTFAYPESSAILDQTITLREETLDDVSSAIALLQQEERVNGQKIFVLGHSLGGMLTPFIATEHPELAGIISMAGSLRPLYEIIYDQNMVIKESLDSDMLDTLAPRFDQLEEDLQLLRSGDLSGVQEDILLMGLSPIYQQSIIDYAGENYIDNVTQPMLILQGSEDFQVFADTDFSLWEETLAGRDNVTFKLYEGLNHMMMPAKGFTDSDEYEFLDTVETQVTDDIATFILKN